MGRMKKNRMARARKVKGEMKISFVDLHAHGMGRYDTRTKNPEMILEMARLHEKKGTGLIYPAIYPADTEAMRAQMRAVKEAMAKSPATGGIKIGGINLEGPFLNPSRCGALDSASFKSATLLNLKRLIGGFEDIIRIITIAPELTGAKKLIARCAGLGIRVNMGHSDATMKEAREGKMAGAAGVTHLFNAMRPFHHREPGLAGFALLDDDTYVEVIADGVHLSLDTLAIVFKIKRPERIILVSDAVKGGGKDGKPVYQKGSSSLLAGGGMAVSECAQMLKKSLGVQDRLLELWGRKNPLRFIGRNS